MKRHIILPDWGQRLFNQSAKDSIRIVCDMPKAAEDLRTVILFRDDITKDQAIADLKAAIQYTKKDF